MKSVLMADKFDFQGQISHVAWPKILCPWASGIVSLLYQLNDTQYASEDTLKQRQLAQAIQLIRYAEENTEFYKTHFRAAELDVTKVSTWEGWKRVPIVTRSQLQQAGDSWRSKCVPQDHGELYQHFTSGSTGKPLHSLSTSLTHLMKCATILRQHQWAGRDTKKRAAFINEVSWSGAEKFRISNNWEEATKNILNTGETACIDIKTTVVDQVDIINDFKPSYLIGYPSVIKSIATYCREKGIGFDFLEQVGTFGEVLEQDCRDLVFNTWGIDIFDNYSAKEIGPIAIQCPENAHYHIQSEFVLVEILDEKGNEVKEGEIGRVVLTSLHNFAAPIIRYEIGDYAEKGKSCSCERSLPVLNRILGRQRNMLTYPDGSQCWPSLGESKFAELMHKGLPVVKQFQLKQIDSHTLEVNVVLDRPYSEEEELQVKRFLHEELGEHWSIVFCYPNSIQRGANGKYEDVMNLYA